jgi:hypothetical protein
VAPLDPQGQRALLIAAIPVLAAQRVVHRYFEEEGARLQRYALAQAALHGATQSQSQAQAEAAAEEPQTLRALLATWAHLLQRLLPAALTDAEAGKKTEAAAAAIVDGALGVLRLSSLLPPVLHKLADEALRALGPSELPLPLDSALWREILSKVYKAPSSAAGAAAPLRLSTLALGLKALLILKDASYTKEDDATAGAGAAVVGAPSTAAAVQQLPLQQLVAFLEGMLARSTDPEGEVVLPRPFLRLYYAALAQLLAAQPSPATRSGSRQAHALSLVVLRMLPAFAARGAARVAAVFPSADALKEEAGGPLLEQWANLFARCLARAEAPPSSSTTTSTTATTAGHNKDNAGASQSQSQFAEWAMEDPAEAVTAAADVVLAPLFPPTPASSSSKALAALWCPLAHRALRCLNTALYSKGSGGGKGSSAEAQRVREALLAPAIRLATALLLALQPPTAPGSGASVCLCDTCGAASTTTSTTTATTTRGQTWLGACLRPAPGPAEWTLDLITCLAQALAEWWGPLEAASSCRAALAKEAARVTDSFLDSLAGTGGGARRSTGSLGGASGASAGLLLQMAPGKALVALQPLLLTLLSHGGEDGKARVQALWQGAGLGKRTDLGLGASEGSKAQALRSVLQGLARSGAIASRDPALGGEGIVEAATRLPAAGNNGGGGRRPSSAGSSVSSGSPAANKKRPSSSSSSTSGGVGGGGGGKRAKG